MPDPSPPKPSVLVVGHFPDKLSFASEALQKIQEVYDAKPWSPTRRLEPKNATLSEDHDRSHRIPSHERLLEPVQLDDGGDAGSNEFKRALYDEFQKNDIWGVISCCTAENSAKLLDALDPIDTPILIALDNTVARSALQAPNLLQLIPNNALQAQAILSEVTRLWGDRPGKATVNVYLWPSQDEFVRDLRTELVDRTNESQNSRITLNQITVGKTLGEIGATLTESDILLYVGYVEGLERVLDLVKRAKLVLSDACNERRVDELMRTVGRPYFISQSSFDPSVYACQGYLSLTKIWLEWSRGGSDSKYEQGLESFVTRVRTDLENSFVGSYRFVGVTNQSGGYIIREVKKGRVRK